MLLVHLVAWGVTLAVGVAFIAANMREESLLTKQPVLFNGKAVEFVYYGWPVFFGEGIKGVWGNTGYRDFILHPIPLIFNIVEGLLFVAVTFFVFVFPLLRKRKPFQVKLESLFILTATVAVLCAIYRLPTSIAPFAFSDPTSDVPLSPRFFYDLPIYLQIPLGLGVGCSIYLSIWIAVRLVTTLVRGLGNQAT